jgi:hypothetical protein
MVAVAAVAEPAHQQGNDREDRDENHETNLRVRKRGNWTKQKAKGRRGVWPAEYF